VQPALTMTRTRTPRQVQTSRRVIAACMLPGTRTQSKPRHCLGFPRFCRDFLAMAARTVVPDLILTAGASHQRDCKEAVWYISVVQTYEKTHLQVADGPSHWVEKGS
jgi:hypothetical protein